MNINGYVTTSINITPHNLGRVFFALTPEEKAEFFDGVYSCANYYNSDVANEYKSMRAAFSLNARLAYDEMTQEE